ncbi:MAG: GNAT family N-acetyltransferase [Bosea sp. (in: a-proteobacteria)]|uniref:GNAT family N-acetyltransferase n=1 Tax=Bosea sp. (in: a-proteobacteria) TaxID=1871050 RepID=UPI0027334988|nr:GNAT family N-acetyltransferase [Bosea sp. (in: a-proteobacteria)]MDP3255809.1 GNAT family N-acetyltransferase [Bosea sp. (in: a-proteobacteria)]MDP3320549.1 GNAT family N-acetyltransferase [Bosea sp. (in: a-proteobacteria)]
MARSRKAGTTTGHGEVRRLWPAERDLFKAHLLRLDEATRRERFGTAVNDDFLETYAVTTFGVGGLVYAYLEDGAVRGAAELRGLEDIMAQTGEAAFSVERDWRRRGIGGTLFGRLITAARNRGIRTLYMTCLPENAAMRRLARKFEADLAGGYADVEGVIATGGPTPFTILDEALDTARGFAALALSLQRRLWRPGLFGRSPGA